VSECCATVGPPGLDAGPPATTLDELVAASRALDPPAPDERHDVFRSEAGLLLDRLITQAGRGGGALEIAIGEALAALVTGDRVHRLGYADVGDYAVEVLGIAASTAAKMARRARYLRERPLLREAVWLGEVTPRAADIVMRVAQGEAEAFWVAKAKIETVRSLTEMVKAAGGEVEEEDDEPWERVFVQLDAKGRAELDAAVAVARKIVGATAPKWQCLRALLQDFFAAHAPDGEGGEDVVLRQQVEDWIEPLKKHFEKETENWSFLEPAGAVVAPIPSEPVAEDPWLLHDELRRLNAERNQADEVIGHAGSIFRTLGLWRDAKFASFAHYCSERPRMSVRAVEERIALDRKLYALPVLRKELREGRVSLEKARLIARVADEGTEEEWIEHAAAKTCIELRRELNGDVPLPAQAGAAEGCASPPQGAEASAAADGVAQMCARAGHVDLGVAAEAAVQMCAPAGDVDPGLSTEAAAQMCARAGDVDPELAAEAAAQMCARTDLDLRMPRHVRELLESAIRTVRKEAGAFVLAGQCVRRVAREFIDTWKEVVEERNTVQRRVRERDHGYCIVRGCSRPAAHVHHLEYRSHGGSDHPSNLASLCAVHHLRIVHMGLMRIRGTAPDRLVFELTDRPGMCLGPGGPRPVEQ
jgi:hypothetical protein